MQLRQYGFALAAATLVASCAWAQSSPPTVILSQPIRSSGAVVDVKLQAADASVIAQTLGNALGGTVRIEGALPAPVTLDLSGATARAALDAVAHALYGTWRTAYTVTAGAAPAGAQRPVALGRTVTANLTDVSAHAAFALVARAGGGTLDLPPGIDKSVTLVARDEPVETALDDIAKQAGVAWSVAYTLTPGVGPPAPARPQPAVQPNTSRVRPTLPGATLQLPASPGAALSGIRSFPMPGPPPGTGDNAGKMLAQGLAQVMKMPAAQRKGAVKDFAMQLDQQFRQMQLLPEPRRMDQMQAMRPVYQAALRTYNGLVPAQRREFQPIIDVFNRWIR